MKEIDARGLLCPQPVILAKKALGELVEGELVCIVDNITAKENVSRLATNLEHEYDVEEKNGHFYIKIKKTKKEEANKMKNDNFVIVITTDKIGTGNDELGTVLMKSYTYALTEAKPLPKSIMFLNSGATLTVEGSEVLTNIQKLSDMGVEIISCGTCLDYYGIKEKLAVGIVGNMYTIVEKMHEASKVINI